MKNKCESCRHYLSLVNLETYGCMEGYEIHKEDCKFYEENKPITLKEFTKCSD